MASKSPCNTCPFRVNSENLGAADWLLDLLKMETFFRASRFWGNKPC